MAREAVEGKPYDQFPVQELSEGPFAGRSARILSRDLEDGAYSAVLEVTSPHELTHEEGRLLDVFVLKGEVELTDARKPYPHAGAGHYLYIPPYGSARSLKVAAGSTLFVAVGEQGSGTGESMVVDPEDKPWEVRVQEECEFSRDGTSTNVVKFLRVDDEAGLTVGLSSMWPGSGLACTEWHRTIDEVFALRGDILVRGLDGEPVVAHAGAYFWRPSDSPHLPKYSHTGHFSLFRNLEGGWVPGGSCTFAPAPGWEDVERAYRERCGVTTLGAIS